jgi:5-methyltetrahydropteroyltriglutamate--homocysteine methyltransferase
MLREREEGRAVDGVALDARVRAAVFDAVQKQTAAGLAIVNDGEQGRVDYTVYVKDRLTGFDGESAPLPGIDADEFPEWTEMARQFAPPFQRRPACTGPVEWKDWPAVERDIETLGRATTGAGIEEVFMTSPSPGQIGRFLNNRYYPSDEAYLARVAEVMRREYEAIVRAGFVLQLDCPDLALGRHSQFAHLTLAEFRKVAEMHVAVLNHAVADIPADRMRMHICWASTGGPHHHDVPLADIVDIVVKGRPAGLMVPGANPRHGHEWKVWKGVDLPAGKILIPGVIDSTTNFIEHPDLVAERIERYADVVGRENVIAGCDCGFGTFAGRVQVDSNIVWHKLRSLVEGARLASDALW